MRAVSVWCVEVVWSQNRWVEQDRRSVRLECFSRSHHCVFRSEQIVIGNGLLARSIDP